MKLNRLIPSINAALSGWQFSWEGLLDNRQGEWWLIGQVLILLAHLLKPWPLLTKYEFTEIYYLRIAGTIIISLGIYLAINSLVSLGESLSPLPDPKPGNKLIIKGSYEKCRHPLYRALIICSFGWTIYEASLLHLTLLISLCILLRNKARREERKLTILFPQYKEYIFSTPAIFQAIPWLNWKD